MAWLVEHAAWLLNTRVMGTDGFTPYHRIKWESYAKISVGFGEYVMHMLHTTGPQHEALGKLDPRWAHGYVMGHSKSSNEHHVYEEAKKKAMTVRSVQRVPADQRWKPEWLEAIDTSCQQLYEKRPARGVKTEGLADTPHATAYDKGRMGHNVCGSTRVTTKNSASLEAARSVNTIKGRAQQVQNGSF